MIQPNTDTIVFCDWLTTSGYYRFSPARLANIAIIQAAAVAGTTVTNQQYNDFVRFTGHLYPAFLEYIAFTGVNIYNIAMARKIVSYQNIDEVLTGVTVESIMCSLSIPAGEMGINTKLLIYSVIARTTDFNNLDAYMYISDTDNDITGATLIAWYESIAGEKHFKFYRQLVNKGAIDSNKVYPVDLSAVNDNSPANNARTTTDIDFTTEQFLIITFTPRDNNDNTILADVQVYIDKP